VAGRYSLGNQTQKMDVTIPPVTMVRVDRTRLVAVTVLGAIVLAFIRSPYESPILSVVVPMMRYKDDCLLLAQRDLCGGTVEEKKDAYLHLQNNNNNQEKKTNVGASGCDLLETDVDTDQDGTPDCHDDCPQDPTKTSPGVCGCGISDETDVDGDTIPDCVDECIDNDPEILALCDLVHQNGDDCEGCAKKYFMTWNDCSAVCSNDNIDYCLRWNGKALFKYAGNDNHYFFRSATLMCFPTGLESSDSKIEFKLECDRDGCEQNTYWKGVQCNYDCFNCDDNCDNYNDHGDDYDFDNDKKCLYCDNGEVNCHDGFPPSSSSPFFTRLLAYATSVSITSTKLTAHPMRLVLSL